MKEYEDVKSGIAEAINGMVDVLEAKFPGGDRNAILAGASATVTLLVLLVDHLSGKDLPNERIRDLAGETVRFLRGKIEAEPWEM